MRRPPFFGQFTAKIKLKKGQALRLPLSIELPWISYLKYLFSKPLNPAPWRASSFAIS